MKLSVLLLIPCLLVACSGVCEDAGINGRYELKSNDRLYSLELNDRGIGALSVDGRTVGDLRWALLDDEEERLELDASGSAYEFLRQAGGFSSRPPDAATVHRGTFALPVHCGLQGQLMRFALNTDRAIYFRRTDAK